MRSTRRMFAAASFVVVYASAALAGPPCKVAWYVDPVGNPGTSAVVRCLITFDDGTGPALYAGGPFTLAGGAVVNSIARWDGANWSALGSGMVGPLPTLAAAVNGLGVYDDGNGPALYAAGNLLQAGGQPANRIAKWDGASWSPLGEGLNQAAQAMAVFDDGSGPALYVGGTFTLAGNVPGTDRIARWNGSSWSALGLGLLDGSCNVLYVYDDGTGEALYAGGTFNAAVGAANTGRIAKWDGTNWSSVGGGIDGVNTPRVNTLMAYDDGTGMALHAAGLFLTAGGQPADNFAKWRNGQWSVAGGGVDGNIIRLEVFDDGNGPALYAGGAFTAGNIANPVFLNQVGRWDGKAWEPLGQGVLHTTITTVSGLAVFDDGGGESLFVAGGFTLAGNQPTNNIARWGCAAAPVCYANCDGSTAAPVLNVNDFVCFQQRFAAGDPYANCDGSTAAPVLNVNDFVCFQQRFAAGCP